MLLKFVLKLLFNSECFFFRRRTILYYRLSNIFQIFFFFFYFLPPPLSMLSSKFLIRNLAFGNDHKMIKLVLSQLRKKLLDFY